MKVAVYGRNFSDSFKPFIQEFFSKLSDLGVECFVYQPFSDYLKTRVVNSIEYKTFTKHHEIKDKVKFLFSIGGDGTFLDATTLVRDAKIPIIGVNTGRLGFLSSISINEIDDALDKIFSGQFVIDERILLKLETKNNLFNGNNFALNELTVHKKDSSSMITIHAYLNDEFLNSYWADGLIIATPTGSTAYSLSCGGPIVLPGSSNFEITPIAPHNLNVRPIVIPDDAEVKLKLEGRENNFLISLDSRSESIDSSIELIIKRNDFKISSVRLEPHSHLTTIRNKLNWGLDKRN